MRSPVNCNCFEWKILPSRFADTRHERNKDAVFFQFQINSNLKIATEYWNKCVINTKSTAVAELEAEVEKYLVAIK